MKIQQDKERNSPISLALLLHSTLPFLSWERCSSYAWAEYFCSKTRLDGTTHEQTIICRQLFAGHVVDSRPIERKEKTHRMIIQRSERKMKVVEMNTCLSFRKRLRLGRFLNNHWVHKTLGFVFYVVKNSSLLTLQGEAHVYLSFTKICAICKTRIVLSFLNLLQSPNFNVKKYVHYAKQL